MTGAGFETQAGAFVRICQSRTPICGCRVLPRRSSRRTRPRIRAVPERTERPADGLPGWIAASAPAPQPLSGGRVWDLQSRIALALCRATLAAPPSRGRGPFLDTPGYAIICVVNQGRKRLPRLKYQPRRRRGPDVSGGRVPPTVRVADSGSVNKVKTMNKNMREEAKARRSGQAKENKNGKEVRI